MTWSQMETMSVIIYSGSSGGRVLVISTVTMVTNRAPQSWVRAADPAPEPPGEEMFSHKVLFKYFL